MIFLPKRRVRLIVTGLTLLLSGIAALVQAEPSYVGASGCSCHKREIYDWRFSVHGKAFESLKAGAKKLEKKRAKLDPDKDYTTDRKCLVCHTNGYRKKGGFIDITSTPEMVGVGCEMCHGPGSGYRVLHDEKKGFTTEQALVAGQRYGSKDIRVCTQCHTHKDSPFTEKVHEKYKFDWKSALDKRDTYHQKQSFDFSF